MKTFDLCIVGCGIAGLNLARLLKGKQDILLIDKRNISGQEDMIKEGKLCGGLLAPDAQKEFACQRLSIPVRVLIDPQIFAVNAVDLKTGASAVYQRFYINTDRAKLDRWLYSLSEGHVELWENTLFLNAQKEKDFHKVTVRKNGKEEVFLCKTLVGADGGVSKTARLGNVQKVPRYISVQCAYEADERYFMYYSFFDIRLTDFYGWMIPKADKLVVGYAVSEDRYKKDSMEVLVRRMRELGINPGRKINERSTLIARPEFTALPCCRSGDIPLIGEAGGFISTSSAEGISYALKTSYELYHAIMTDPKRYLALYEKGVAKLRQNIIGKIAKSKIYYTPWIRNAAIRSKIMAVKLKNCNEESDYWNIK
jgi:geranylgeranyl reductase